MKWNRGLGLVVGLSLLITTPLTMGSSPPSDEAPGAPIVVDARIPSSPPKPLPFTAGGTSPDGHSLAANSRYLMRDGKPWFPIMGEFHYSRYPEAHWEEEILRMKAAGIQIISTYVFWIHHEEVEGQFDFTGRRDLRRFVELCAKHGLYVWIRVGPWDHGEVRNGGLPDWVIAKSQPRQNDPAYLGFVHNFFGAIGGQLHGLFWKDGGPIIGVQIENEYGASGPGKGTEHILALLRLAKEAGLEAPFYTVTGWDAAKIPPRDVLPVFSGYVDGFWWRSLTELPPNPNYFFTAIRCQENVGDNLRSTHPEIDAELATYPYLTAEMGAGMEFSYHRRPLLSSDDTAAMELVKLGSGVTMYGYYMFHGGTNPDGKKTTLQESQATGYPNDLPVKSYDFQAPLGEFGQENPSYRDLKLFHLFLADFGADLAPMTTYFPEQAPASMEDTQTPRVAARFQNDNGFLFLNNYQRNYPLPERKNSQLRLELPSGTVDVPRRPVNIPSGMYGIWPVNRDLGEVTLQYSTAQLLTSLSDPKTFVFFAWPGVDAEFAFKNAEGVSIEAPHARVSQEHGVTYVDGIEPGPEAAIKIRGRSGEATIVVLTREQAGNVWKTRLAGKERLVYSPGEVFFDKNQVHLRSTDALHLRMGIFPSPDQVPAGFTDGGSKGIFHTYAASVQPVSVKVEVKKLNAARNSPPVKVGKEVAMAPVDSDFGSAARWSIRVPRVDSSAVKDLLLRITYEGDVARVYTGDNFVTDDFYHGRPLQIGLRSLGDPQSDPELELKVLPLRKDAPIYLPPGTRPPFPASGSIAEVKSVEVVPVYEVVTELKP
jgi:beta-galactosidase